jgi:uncharacterized membrane protein
MAASPDHLDQGVRDISDLHALHYRKATPIERHLDGVVARLSHPALLVSLTIGIIGWIGVNLALALAGGHPIDPPPFPWLQGVASVASAYLATLILTTQSREDGLTRHRDQLTLELAILAERKSAKIIALLEELRRDTPVVLDRIDEAADAMARPADPSAVLSAIEEVHRLVIEEKGKGAASPLTTPSPLADRPLETGE